MERKQEGAASEAQRSVRDGSGCYMILKSGPTRKSSREGQGTLGRSPPTYSASTLGLNV